MFNRKNIRTILAAIMLFFLVLFWLACQKLELTRVVKIKTGEYSNITAVSATLTGEIMDAGEGGIIQYGHCWSISPHPTPDGPNSNFGEAKKSTPITSYATGLRGKTTYYFRAYCKINSEFIYGDEKTFTTPYDAKFYKLPVDIAPKIDGAIDDVWNKIEKNYVERNFYGDSPTIDLAYWQGAWNDSTLFILISVNEDSHCDQWCAGQEDWYADKPEVYIDINSVLKDGLGSKDGLGHFQYTQSWKQNVNAFTNLGVDWQGTYYHYGYILNAPNYVVEYATYWSLLKDKSGVTFVPFNDREFGFDVSIIDRDEGTLKRNYSGWRNIGGPEGNLTTGNYFNMDGAGVVAISTEIINYP